MIRQSRIFIFLCLSLFAFSPYSWADLLFEGFLHEVQISQLHKVFDGSEERIIEKKLALLLSMPTVALLPTGLFQQIFFVLLEIQDELEPFVEKHVRLQGEWKGMAFPCFENVAILKVSQISEDCLLNNGDLDETSFCFLEENIPIMAEAACRLARWQALASGCKVLQVEECWLIEISPDGTKTFVQWLGQ